MDAVKRLRKEIKEIRKESSKQGDPDIVMHPDEENILNWTAFIRGPRDSPYENGKQAYFCWKPDSSTTPGVFELSIEVVQHYPVVPPDMKFITKVFHPNVHFKVGKEHRFVCALTKYPTH
jgi:peroxin-4